MIEIIPPHTRIDFVGIRRYFLIGSLVAIGLSVVLFLVRGPNLGIDFAGGSLVHVRFAQPTQIETVRSALGKTDLGALDIQDLRGTHGEFLIRVPLSPREVEDVSQTVTAALVEQFGKDQVEILRVEAVGPRVGAALREKAILAVLFATVMMGVYIWARFQWRFGVGAAAALFHDVIIVVGALVLFNYEFDLTVLAALLTVVGFSVNDTVIISDRIRENMRKDRRSGLPAVINASINETLSRTVLTTGTALFVVLSLFILGGSVIHGFAFALLVGFLVGTYSSIFIASPTVLFFERGAAAGRRG